MASGATGRKSERMGSLDLLRLVAALAVLFFHYLFHGSYLPPLLANGYPEAGSLAIYGYMGVNLFFLISGFVIAWSAEGRNWTEFAAARFARLYPGFLVCMTASFIVQTLAANPTLPYDPSIWAANLFIVAPAFNRPFVDGVYWSIVMEIIFYGWIAIALFLGVFSRWKLQIVAAWLLISVINETVIHSTALQFVLITQYAPYFAGGILAQHIVAKGSSIEALVLLGAAFLLSCREVASGADWMQANFGFSPSLAQLLAANVVVYGLFGGALLLRRRIAPTPLVLMLGGLTYPLYLLHQEIGTLWLNALSPAVGRWVALAIVLTALLSASFVISFFIEKPIRKPLISLLLPPLNMMASKLRLDRPA
ncbi:acyltransferase [Mesorhizobium sp. STM 4661]|uniref:acyltransferase family protein n=1 Tax=Mesorhizobium sp. STM 4661 TaxID=1297570 RepID=UPI0002BEB0C4|nr:acyltransferase [Mesorhizobium sp. STM 4661]CCV15073.1 putative acetyltransferase [Mesorhizobium sp. STM 4661]